MSVLYIVATPIGNLEDITIRALRILKEVDLIAAEDTRVTRKLLGKHDIHTRMTSYNDHNKTTKLPLILNTLSEKNVALVSDAGMPTINDPGCELVFHASQAGFQVTPVPGPSAITSAIAISGMPIDQFVYLGFLPRKHSQRIKILKATISEKRSLVIFETPHRIRSSFEDMLATLGNRRISVCRELTKIHEEIFRGTISEALSHFHDPRGEFTLVIDGNRETEDHLSYDEAMNMLKQCKQNGILSKDSISMVVRKCGIPRKIVYRLWLET